MSDKLKQLLKKLKALAEQGVGGEAVNAQAMLEKLCRDNGIELADLESDERQEYRFKCKKQYNKLFIQVASTIVGLNVDSWRYVMDESRIVYMKCTAAQAVEINQKFNFYFAKFMQEYELFYGAFIRANDIYPCDSEGVEWDDLTQEEKDKMRKEALLAQGLERHQYLKQLNKG